MQNQPLEVVDGKPADHIAELGFKEFVFMLAAIMATNALAVDIMLPALPAMGTALGVAVDNQRQWIVTAYLLGFGGGQIFYGTISDRFGRKPVLLFGLGLFVAFSVLAGVVSSFSAMLAVRLMQGIGGAAGRVLALALVRDRYAGPRMAQVASMVYIVVLAAPVAAPGIGQLVLLMAPWPCIFAGLAVFGMAVFVWVAMRLPETLPPSARRPISPERVLQAFQACTANRVSAGYIVASTLMVGTLYAFINSSQQIYAEVFHEARSFPFIYGTVAMFMVFSSLHNARIVLRKGMHSVSHAALLVFVCAALANAALALSEKHNVWSFTGLQALLMYCFGLMVSNFAAIAMTPMGHVAGTAASVQGVITTTGGAVAGLCIGQLYDRTPIPMSIGVALFAIAALLVIGWTERGRLFGSAVSSLNCNRGVLGGAGNLTHERQDKN